jgi:glycine cleavage system H protein
LIFGGLIIQCVLNYRAAFLSPGSTAMTEPLSFTVDKFTFTIPTDRLYHPDGLWIQERDSLMVVGVTDYFQQQSGDVAFAEMAEGGSAVLAGKRLGNIETIKVDNEVAAPFSGTIVEVNDKLTFEAEVINQDPYGDGWLAKIAPADWNTAREALMTPQAYYDHSRAQALEEAGKP